MNSYIKTVNIADGVTSIGTSAFQNCSSLTSIGIPNSVTSIGGSAFSGCTGLTSVVIPNSVTSIGGSAFSGCSSLTEVTIPNSVTTIGDGAFSTTNLKTLIVGSGVLSIGSNAFSTKPTKTFWLTNTPPENYTVAQGAINYVANNQYSGLNNMKEYKFLSSMFEVDGVRYVPISPSERTCDVIDCVYNDSITEVSITPTVSYKSVSMTVQNVQPYTFYNNLYIKTARFDIDGSLGKYVFGGCNSLQAVMLGQNVKGIEEYAFSGCSKLESIIIPETVDTIGQYAFSNCTGMKSVVIGNGTKTIGHYAFYNCTGLNTINIGEGESSIGSYSFSGCSNLSSVNIGNGLNSIANYAFSGCSSLQSISLGEGTNTINQYAFQNCSSLPSITIPGSVNSIGNYAFSGCKGLKTVFMADSKDSIIIIPFDDRNLKNYESMSINVSAGDELSFNYKLNNSGYLYIDGTYLQNESGTFNKIVSYSGTIYVNFYSNSYGNDNSCDITGMKLTKNNNLIIGSNGGSPMFSDCPLDSVYIGRNISYNTSSSYGYSPFYRNTTLRSVTITDKETEISENEFYGCTNLQNVQIGDGVTSIGNWAYSGCSSLKNFSFGTQVQTIGKEAFSDCIAVTSITSKAQTPPTCDSQALDDINKWDCKLYVPEGHVADYQTADQWKEFFFVEEGEGGGDTPIDPTGNKCATPIIEYVDGKLSFSCETEGVKYIYTIIPPSITSGEGDNTDFSTLYTIKVYATKEGYEDSDVVTKEINVGGTIGIKGDVNEDGTVNGTDIQEVINIIVNAE